jgi:hypothetical protein
VLSKIRRDFNAADGVQSNEQILYVMNQLMFQAAGQAHGTRKGAFDVAEVMLKRNLASR